MAEVTTESPSVPKNPWGSPHRAQPPPTVSTLQLGQAPRTPSHRSRPCPLAHCSQNSHSGPCLQRSPPVTSTSLPGASQPLSEQETHSSQLHGDLGVRVPSYCWSVLRPSGSLSRDLGHPLPGPSRTSRVWRVGVSEAAQHSGLEDPGDPLSWGRQAGSFSWGCHPSWPVTWALRRPGAGAALQRKHGNLPRAGQCASTAVHPPLPPAPCQHQARSQQRETGVRPRAWGGALACSHRRGCRPTCSGALLRRIPGLPSVEPSLVAWAGLVGRQVLT